MARPFGNAGYESLAEQRYAAPALNRAPRPAASGSTALDHVDRRLLRQDAVQRRLGAVGGDQPLHHPAGELLDGQVGRADQRAGGQADLLFGVDWSERWDHPLDDVRAELGVVPAPQAAAA